VAVDVGGSCWTRVGVAEGVCVKVGVGVCVDVGDGVAVGVTVFVGVRVGVAEGVRVGVAVLTGVLVAVALAARVAVGPAVGCATAQDASASIAKSRNKADKLVAGRRVSIRCCGIWASKKLSARVYLSTDVLSRFGIRCAHLRVDAS
jgi:hypothetical protein